MYKPQPLRDQRAAVGGRGATRATARLARTWNAALRKCAAPRGNDAPRGGRSPRGNDVPRG
eukprot:7963480-Pyramimonas_sp.AAC.1